MKASGSGNGPTMGTLSSNQRKGSSMTLSRLRHDIRNHLNAIKLSVALMQRRNPDRLADDTLREIDRSADGINELVTQFLGDADAPSFLTEQEEEM
jgi:hypothetical protein